MPEFPQYIRRSIRSKNAYALWIAPLIVLLAMLSVAAFTGFWPWSRNPYSSYVLQACSWLEGRLDLGQDYPWLELAIYEGKYYVSSCFWTDFGGLIREHVVFTLDGGHLDGF